MILNGHYIYIFSSTPSSHETELYFTLTQAQTLYFAFLGATIKIDDETTLVTPDSYTMTSANYNQYPGVSHSFTAGNHKVFIDSTNPSVPYTSYNDYVTYPTGGYGQYVDAGNNLEKDIASCFYDTRQIGGRAQYQSTGKAIFYLKNNYFNNIVVSGRIPDYAWGKSNVIYYNGSNQLQSLTYGSWASLTTVDFSDCSVIGNGILMAFSNTYSLLAGNTFNQLEKVGHQCQYIFGDNGLGGANSDLTSYVFPKLKTIGNSSFHCSGTVKNWQFPVLEELGTSNFGGSNSTGGTNTCMISDENNELHLPNIKTIGDFTFTYRGQTASASSITGRPMKIYLGNKVTSIGSSCFLVYTNYNHTVVPATKGFEVYINATTPPTLGTHSFDSYDYNYRRYYADGNKILVPSRRVTTYKNAAGFSSYKSYIYAQ